MMLDAETKALEEPSAHEAEVRLWLRLLGATTSNAPAKETLRTLYRESDELVRILSTILRNSIS